MKYKNVGTLRMNYDCNPLEDAPKMRDAILGSASFVLAMPGDAKEIDVSELFSIKQARRLADEIVADFGKGDFA